MRGVGETFGGDRLGATSETALTCSSTIVSVAVVAGLASLSSAIVDSGTDDNASALLTSLPTCDAPHSDKVELLVGRDDTL